jgi:para-aminobenzoate synthetase/4-amino-4-deoxychorismate lyase
VSENLHVKRHEKEERAKSDEALGYTNEGVRHLERHLRRLQSSALYFGFPFKDTHLRQMLSAHCAGMTPNTSYRIRASLNAAGEFQVSVAPLMALRSDGVDVLHAPEQGFALQSHLDCFQG